MIDRLTGNDRDLLTWVQRYYPPTAVKCRIEVASEYNDSTYNNSVCYIAVLDSNGQELAPLAGKESISRKALRSMDLHYMDETDDLCPDYEVTLNQP